MGATSLSLCFSDSPLPPPPNVAFQRSAWRAEPVATTQRACVARGPCRGCRMQGDRGLGGATLLRVKRAVLPFPSRLSSLLGWKPLSA